LQVGVVTVLWQTLSADDRAVLDDASRRYGPELEIVRTPKGSIGQAVLPALVEGGVVAVVTDDDDASRVLGLGVDEVVRSGRLTARRLDDAVARARTRADARVVRESLARSSADDDAFALRTLAGAVCHEVNNPLAAAMLDVSSLESSLEGLLELHALLLRVATQAAPKEQRRQIEKRAEAAPSTEELHAMVQNIAQAVSRAASAMRRFSVLASAHRSDEGLGAAVVVSELGAILRGYVDATLSVETRGECLVDVPRAAFVTIVGAIMAHALDAVRLGSRPDRRIFLRATEEENVVLVEVEHSGASIPPDLRPNVFGPFFRREGAPPATGLQGIRERARRWGGEFLVIAEPTSTTFRLVLPRREPSSVKASEGARRAVESDDVED
jgi:signal transduction histidine kinase